MNISREYPRDLYIEIENQEALLGKITLYKVKEGYNAEIAVVWKENNKIWRHIDNLYKIVDEDDAVDFAVNRLGQFLRGEK